ncbi:MAG: FAD-linked oxidase C-terminal domain-containing protein [Pseudomonadota bacterium]
MRMPEPDAGVVSRRDEIVAKLGAVLPEDALIWDERETKAYDTDALTAYACRPLAVALPRTTEEVSAVMRVCHAEGVPVIPRGSGTGLAGGALPTADAVVLGVSRMNAVLETDYDDRVIRVQTGRTNLSVTGAVEQDGFFYAPDPSSQLACAIAGNIAMNSGGAHCLKYGVTTNNLLGVKMVTVTGEVLEIGGPGMDAPGYDLLGVICGSEGQLGVVTEAWLRILPKPEGARPILIAFDSAATAGRCVSDVIKAGVLPVAIEYMDKPIIHLTEAFVGAGYPMEAEAMLIVEVEGSPAEIDEQLEKIKAIAAPLQPTEMRESSGEAQSAAIWKGRKAAFGATGSVADYLCMDGTIPTSALPEALERIDAVIKRHGLRVANVFHAGDGNLHPLIMFNANAPGELEKAEAAGAEILTLCVELGGCLTGEHGVGVEKRDLMHRQYGADDLDAQMAVKDVFDPAWRLNAAKVFPLDASAERRAG